MTTTVKIIECPRDAWQGLPDLIPTEYKTEYLRDLVLTGFKHIDAVSFVSPKHLKQMADSEEVMAKLNTFFSKDLPAGLEAPEIIGIVVNERGLERALATPGVTTAFGNPYDEPWGPEIVVEALEWLKDIRVRTVSLADTVGNAAPQLVGDLYRSVKDHTAGIELGVHLHSRPDNAEEKIRAAYEAGCRRFDGALTGIGGCPFAGDNLVGNIATEDVIAVLRKAGADPGIDSSRLAKVLEMTNEIRAKYAHAPLVN